jgi:glycosyltransferase involved in cell wall biosynthesis
MRLLLFVQSNYMFNVRGGNKENRLLLEALSARGHDCRVYTGYTTSESHHFLLTRRNAETQGDDFRAVSDDVIEFKTQGVSVVAFRFDEPDAMSRLPMAASYYYQRGVEFQPDVILITHEPESMPSIAMHALAEAVGPGRTVAMLQVVEAYRAAGGPTTTRPNLEFRDALRKSAGAISKSEFARDYVRRWIGLESKVIRFPAFGSPPFPVYTNPDAGFVLAINPGTHKGIDVLVKLAESMPNVAFAAVPGWNTTPETLARLRSLPNFDILPFYANLDELFCQARVLLVPSTCLETFGNVVVDAMVRGIPVIASDAGGLPEAKLDVEYVVPIRTIEWEQLGDETFRPHFPDQDVGPWAAALQELLSDQEHYRDVAKRSRDAALAYIEGVDCKEFEDYLGEVAAAAPARSIER